MKTLALLLLACASGSAAGWADRAEYDMVLAIRAEAVPEKRVALLDQWKAKYPASGYQQARRELYFAAFQAMDDSRRMLDTAAEMVAVQPGQPFGAYWLTVLLPGTSSASPEQLALAEKAAQSLIASKASGSEVLAHRALGWVRWQRKEYTGAEEEFRACLKLEPSRAEISAWLGTMLAAQQQPANYSAALWHMARAVSVKDAGTLPPAQKKQLSATLEKLYTTYHGEAAGLDQLLAAAAAAIDPPAGFEIESATALALARDNPRLAEWLKMRRKLESDEGDKYFADSLKSNPLPRLKGTLLAAQPADKPTELTIAVSDPAVPEIVIKLSVELPNGAVSGTPLEFEGAIDSYKKSPFALTILSDPARIIGWPAK